MTTDEFVCHYPLLYHMAEPGTWSSIRRHGLLSTAAILDLVQADSDLIEKLLSRRRPQIVDVEHPEHGHFRIRDQKPLKDSFLKRSLTDMPVPDWYRLLNSRVFLWPTFERVNKLLNARAYRGRSHTVITVDSGELLERHAEDITLSHINSGATVYQPTPRGSTTFRSLADWPSAVGPRSGQLLTAVAEVAVRYGLPDVAAFTVKVEERQGGEVLRVLA